MIVKPRACLLCPLSAILDQQRFCPAGISAGDAMYLTLYFTFGCFKAIGRAFAVCSGCSVAFWGVFFDIMASRNFKEMWFNGKRFQIVPM